MLLDARFFVWLMRNGGAALARTQEAWHNEYALSSIWCRAAQHYLQLRLLNRTDAPQNGKTPGAVSGQDGCTLLLRGPYEHITSSTIRRRANGTYATTYQAGASAVVHFARTAFPAWFHRPVAWRERSSPRALAEAWRGLRLGAHGTRESDASAATSLPTVVGQWCSAKEGSSLRPSRRSPLTLLWPPLPTGVLRAHGPLHRTPSPSGGDGAWHAAAPSARAVSASTPSGPSLTPSIHTKHAVPASTPSSLPFYAALSSQFQSQMRALTHRIAALERRVAQAAALNEERTEALRAPSDPPHVVGLSSLPRGSPWKSVDVRGSPLVRLSSLPRGSPWNASLVHIADTGSLAIEDSLTRLPAGTLGGASLVAGGRGDRNKALYHRHANLSSRYSRRHLPWGQAVGGIAHGAVSFCVLRDPSERAVASFNRRTASNPMRNCGSFLDSWMRTFLARGDVDSPSHSRMPLARGGSMHLHSHHMPQAAVLPHCALRLCFDRLPDEFAHLVRAWHADNRASSALSGPGVDEPAIERLIHDLITRSQHGWAAGPPQLCNASMLHPSTRRALLDRYAKDAIAHRRTCVEHLRTHSGV